LIGIGKKSIIKHTINKKDNQVKNVDLTNSQLGHVEINLSNVIDWISQQMSQILSFLTNYANEENPNL
jgi:hypothetical protein